MIYYIIYIKFDRNLRGENDNYYKKILLLILRFSLTQSACAQFLEANFPKNLLLFWENWRIQT